MGTGELQKGDVEGKNDKDQKSPVKVGYPHQLSYDR
jgi:hypothetical protein